MKDINLPYTKKLKLFFMCFTVTQLMFGVDSVLELSPDTYATFCTHHWSWMLYGNGRVINAFVYYVIEEILHLTPSMIYTLSYSSAIIFLTISIYLLSKTVYTFCNNLLCAFLVSVITVANIFSIEFFLFIEKGLFMFGLLLTIMSVRHTIKFFSNKNMRELFIVELLLICIVFIYQVFLGYYVILLLPFITKYSKSFYHFGVNNMLVAMAYGLNMGLGFATTKYILKSSRLVAKYQCDSANTLKRIWEVCIHSEEILPRGIFAIIIAIAILLNIMLIKNKKLCFLYIIYLLIGVTFVAYFPYFMGVTSDFVLRIMYPFASIAGVLLLCVLIHVDANQKVEDRYNLLHLSIIGVTLLYITIQCYSFNSIFIDRYKCNQTDKYICSIIIDRINKYQLESNVEISTICIYEDAQTTTSYDGLATNWWLIPRAFITSWGDVNAINYYSGRFYERGEQKDEIREYFLSQNWDTFSDDQLIFDEQTLHLCIY